MADGLYVVIVGDAPNAELAGKFIRTAYELAQPYTGKDAAVEAADKIKAKANFQADGRTVDTYIEIDPENRRKYMIELQNAAFKLMGTECNKILITEGTVNTFCFAQTFRSTYRQENDQLRAQLRQLRP